MARTTVAAYPLLLASIRDKQATRDLRRAVKPMTAKTAAVLRGRGNDPSHWGEENKS